MRITELTALHARIPLKRQIRHASQTRSDNDALLIRCQLDDGTAGWGEGLPRPYVTGESIDSAWNHFLATDLAGALGGSFDTLAQAVDRLDQLTPAVPAGERDCFGNAFRCAVELAVLDAVCRATEIPLSDVLSAMPETAEIRERQERVRYSAAISSTALPKAMFAAAVYRYYGFRFCKLKVGARRGDAALVRGVRAVAGAAMDLRVDVNEAWHPGELERRVAQLRGARLSAIEQPLPHADAGALRRLRPRLGVPIVLDESLCSASDARRAIDEGLCDIFNVRLSKCGGLIRSARLLAFARRAGLACQLGCQVGETGLLSAAGRHLACAVNELRYLEGSFDRILVAEPLIREDITFRRGGWGSRLDGFGLGVTIDPEAVRRVTLRTEVRRLE